MPLFIKVAYNLRFCRFQGLSVDCVERGSLFYFKVFLDNPDNMFYIDLAGKYYNNEMFTKTILGKSIKRSCCYYPRPQLIVFDLPVLFEEFL